MLCLVESIYMSNGKCHDTCLSSYAFAIVQDDNCWCSNDVPADQVSTGDCDTSCPGFPDDKCGNSADGLYGYIQLNIAPSGTSGGSASIAKTSVSNIPTAQLLPFDLPRWIFRLFIFVFVDLLFYLLPFNSSYNEAHPLSAVICTSTIFFDLSGALLYALLLHLCCSLCFNTVDVDKLRRSDFIFIPAFDSGKYL
jgi:hypothetical protein